MNLTRGIKNKAIESGFDLVGIADASPIDPQHSDILAEWLNHGYAGQMEYMHRNLSKRINPMGLMKDAQSVIVVGLNYNPPKKEIETDTNRPTGNIVTYAQYEDYHPFIKKRLKRIVDYIACVSEDDLHFKICVDSVPVAERALAVRAGLGFIGKNHMLINPALGCRMFLGEIITNLKLQYDTPVSCDEPICQTCNKCINSCPAGALRRDGRFDAAKCINYLTIEYDGQIQPELVEIIGDRLFGCDKCIDVCPYQNNAPVCGNDQFKFYNDRAKIDLQEVLDLSVEAFEAKFFDSVIKRSGLEKLKRNAEICFKNITKYKKEEQT